MEELIWTVDGWVIELKEWNGRRQREGRKGRIQCGTLICLLKLDISA